MLGHLVDVSWWLNEEVLHVADVTMGKFSSKSSDARPPFRVIFHNLYDGCLFY